MQPSLGILLLFFHFSSCSTFTLSWRVSKVCRVFWGFFRVWRLQGCPLHFWLFLLGFRWDLPTHFWDLQFQWCKVCLHKFLLMEDMGVLKSAFCSIRGCWLFGLTLILTPTVWLWLCAFTTPLTLTLGCQSHKCATSPTLNPTPTFHYLELLSSKMHTHILVWEGEVKLYNKF